MEMRMLHHRVKPRIRHKNQSLRMLLNHHLDNLIFQWLSCSFCQIIQTSGLFFLQPVFDQSQIVIAVVGGYGFLSLSVVESIGLG